MMVYRDYHLYPDDKKCRHSDYLIFYPLYALTDEGPRMMKDLCAMYHRAGPLSFFGSLYDVMVDENFDALKPNYVPAYLSEVWYKMGPVVHLTDVERTRTFVTLSKDRPEQVAQAEKYLESGNS